jgi:FAD/FMN-containing dehydrogenase
MTLATVMESTAATCVLDPDNVRAFAAGVRGEVLTPGDPGYDAARRVWNGLIDKRPAIIVRCADAADVIASVTFARTHDLLLAVRGGGHSAAGAGVCDGGIVVDLSQMRGVRVDPVARTACADGGATWGDFDHATQAFGLATTGGVLSTTGIGGLTLGGGIGWLMRKHGLACDNLLSVDVVTADGRFLTASATEHPDLFWGVRGGGGNFGVATSFEYRLHPVGQVLAGVVVHPVENALAVHRFFREFTATAPEEVTTYAFHTSFPELGPVAAIAACYAGPVATGEAVLGPLRAFGPPLVDTFGLVPYNQWQTLFDAQFPHGNLAYWKASYLRAIDDDAFAVLGAKFAEAPSSACICVVEHMGGAIGRVGEDETAIAHRKTSYNFNVAAIGFEAPTTAAHVAWVRGCWAAMQPFADTGVYLNYLLDEGEDRIKAAYGDANHARLVALKTTYDPTNLFRVNQNITPAR